MNQNSHPLSELVYICRRFDWLHGIGLSIVKFDLNQIKYSQYCYFYVVFRLDIVVPFHNLDILQMQNQTSNKRGKQPDNVAICTIMLTERHLLCNNVFLSASRQNHKEIYWEGTWSSYRLACRDFISLTFHNLARHHFFSHCTIG